MLSPSADHQHAWPAQGSPLEVSKRLRPQGACASFCPLVTENESRRAWSSAYRPDNLKPSASNARFRTGNREADCRSVVHHGIQDAILDAARRNADDADIGSTDENPQQRRDRDSPRALPAHQVNPSNMEGQTVASVIQAALMKNGNTRTIR